MNWDGDMSRSSLINLASRVAGFNAMAAVVKTPIHRVEQKGGIVNAKSRLHNGR
jgi:hypothetical protein